MLNYTFNQIDLLNVTNYNESVEILDSISTTLLQISMKNISNEASINKSLLIINKILDLPRDLIKEAQLKYNFSSKYKVLITIIFKYSENLAIFLIVLF